ncbi:MAG: hypothetical protein QF893_09455 [Alphaproteobacteria bacterium]|jgi:methyl-accepting chemotaxis protein|nr:hypothetical protein [Alphaproteobacteria bacterium]
MTNWSSLSKAQLASAGSALAALGLVAIAVTGAGGIYASLALGGVAVASALLAIRFQRRAARAAAQALGVCRAVAGGDFEARIIDIREGGELGETLWAINELIDRTDAFLRESAASMQYVSRNQYFRRIIEKGMVGSFLGSGQTINAASQAIATKVGEFRGVADRFESRVKHVAETLAATATELDSTSDEMKTMATSAGERSVAVAAAAEEASTNVQTVAAASEQLTGSIREISTQLARAGEITADAVSRTDRANTEVEGLASVLDESFVVYRGEA